VKPSATLPLTNWEPFSGLLTSPYLWRGKAQGGYPDVTSSFPQHRTSLNAWRGFLSAPAFATDFSEGADFGGTYSYIGPGVASLPDVDVDVGPLGAGVYVDPGVAFMSPAMDYAAPASTWTPVYPETLEVVAPAADIDVGPAATGAEVGVP
jgi:hypothetical protein